LVVLNLSCFGSQFLLAELSDRFPEKLLFLCERKIQLLHQRVNSQDCRYLKLVACGDSKGNCLVETLFRVRDTANDTVNISEIVLNSLQD